MKAPWQYFPTSLIENFTALDLPPEARSASLAARVARWRAFANTTMWAEIVDRIATFASSDEAALNPARPWHCSSLVAEFREISELPEREREAGVSGTSRSFWRTLSGTKEERWQAARLVIEKRASRWTPEPRHVCDDIRRFLCRRPSSELVFSVIRFLCYP